MKKITTNAILIVVFIAAPLTVQSSNEIPGVWRTISNENEEIDFEIPEMGYKNQSSGDPDNYRGSYSAKVDGSIYFVHSDRNVESTEFEAALKLASLFENKCSTEDFGLYRFYGCTFTESAFHTHTFKVIRTFKRVYTFYVVTPSGPTPETEKFLNSARWVRSLEGLKNIGFVKIDALWKRFVDGEFRPKLDSINKRPAKRTELLLKKQDIRNRPLRLLTKPRPGYTEMARRFAVTGTVRLTVTLNADGTVGPVSVQKAVPFGLTQKAIEAATAISFEPEIRNGHAISLKKKIAYNFSIY